MRAIAKKLGAPYSICEVMTDSFVSSLKDRAKTRHHLYLEEGDHPAGAQLMGSEPDEFPGAALKLVEAGFDVVDINVRVDDVEADIIWGNLMLRLRSCDESGMLFHRKYR